MPAQNCSLSARLLPKRRRAATLASRFSKRQKASIRTRSPSWPSSQSYANSCCAVLRATKVTKKKLSALAIRKRTPATRKQHAKLTLRQSYRPLHHPLYQVPQGVSNDETCRHPPARKHCLHRRELGRIPSACSRSAPTFSLRSRGLFALFAGQKFFRATRRLECLAAKSKLGEEQELRGLFTLPTFPAPAGRQPAVRRRGRPSCGHEFSDAGSRYPERLRTLRHR